MAYISLQHLVSSCYSSCALRHQQPPYLWSSPPPRPKSSDRFVNNFLSVRFRNIFSVTNCLNTLTEANFGIDVDLQDKDFLVYIANLIDISDVLLKYVLSREVNSDCNLVFSPLSIQMLIGLIAAGSKGPTQDQLLSFLKFKSTDDLITLYSHLFNFVLVDGRPDGGPCLCVANGVWVDKTLSFNPSFKQIADRVCNAELFSVDFYNKADEVVAQGNEWVRKKTNNLIQEIIAPGKLDKSIRLILANALYFNGLWKEAFDASKTEDHLFNLLGGGSVRTPFMTSKKKQYIKVLDGFKVLMLPYEQGMDTRRFCMYLILPDALDGLPTLLDKISSQPIFFNDYRVPFGKIKVRNLLIPRFQINFALQVSNVLEGLGLNHGMTEMVDSTVFVQDIYLKSFIVVNEEGTEDGALTIARARPISYQLRKEIDFVADHPFLFIIRDESTGVVLFTGTVLNPQSG